jgi:hypothetical protein
MGCAAAPLEAGPLRAPSGMNPLTTKSNHHRARVGKEILLTNPTITPSMHIPKS